MTVASQQNRPSSDTSLPEGWRRVPLSSVTEVRFSNVDKRTNPGELPVRLCNYMDVYTNDYIVSGMPFMRASATKSEIARFRIQQGDVILTKDSETPDDIGIPAVVDDAAEDLVCGYHLALVRPDLDEVDPTFLAKQLGHHTTARFFGQRATGSTRYGLANSTVESTPVLLPSLKAQKAVASVVRHLDRAIEQTRALIAKYQRIKTGLMQDLLTRGIDEHGCLRDPAIHKFKPSPLGPIPEEWQTPTIGDVACYVGSGVTPTGGSAVYQHEGVMFIRSQNVTFNGLLLDDVAYISASLHASMKRSEIFAFDTLLNITGASIGRCCCVPFDLGLANINQHVCSIRLPEPRFEDAIFLAEVLASQIGQLQIERFNAGGNREGLNYTHVKSLCIPWPEAEERVAIARHLEGSKKQIQNERGQLTKLQRLKTGLMQDLLTGTVSVEPLLRTQTPG